MGLAKSTGGTGFTVQTEVTGNNSITPSTTNPPLLPVDTASAAPTPWEVNNVSFNQGQSISAQESTPYAVFFKSDGLAMFVVGAAAEVFQYTLSSAWDVSTATYDSKSFDPTSQISFPFALFFKDDGTKMYLGGSVTNIYEYDLSTAWDVSTATYNSNFASVGANVQDMYFKSDGLKLFTATDTSGDFVREYTLSTAWDITSETFTDSISVGTQEATVRSVFFKDDGTEFYVAGVSADTVFQYNCPTPWDLTGASYASVSGNINSNSPDPNGLFFKDDGEKLYVLSGSDVDEYDLESGSGVASTITVNATTLQGAKFAVTDSRSNAATNNITVDFGSNNFHGQSSQTDVFSTDEQTGTYVYVSAAVGFVKL